MHFPHEKTGKKRKLSWPWCGPFRVSAIKDPDLTVTKCTSQKILPFRCTNSECVIYSPDMLPPGFYWYGGNQRSSQRTPSWLQRMLARSSSDSHGAGSSVPEEDRETGTTDPGVARSPVTKDTLALTPHPSADGTFSLEDITPDPSEGSHSQGQGDVRGDFPASKSHNNSGDEDFNQPEPSESGSFIPTQTPPSRYWLCDRSQRHPSQRLMQVRV